MDPFVFLGVVLIHGRTKFLDAEGNKNYLPLYNVNPCLSSETFVTARPVLGLLLIQ